MISLAENVFAFSYLLDVALTVALIGGGIGYFGTRAIRLRIRTRYWTPAVGDRVVHRVTKNKATVEKIEGSRLWISYPDENSCTPNKYETNRSKLLFDSRPARR